MALMQAEIRGMHFRTSDQNNPAPAKLLVETLPNGTELKLVREPGNEYDRNAIQVWLAQSALPEWLDEVTDPLSDAAAQKLDDFQIKLQGYGWDLERFWSQPEFMLGYVAKEVAVNLAGLMDQSGKTAWSKGISFTVSGKGKPEVRVDLATEGQV